VIFSQDRHHFLRFGLFGERREVAQITENDSDLTAMTLQHPLIPCRHKLSYLRRQKALQAPDTLDLSNLLCYPMLERSVPGRELGCLRLHLVVERFDAQDRSHSGHERRLINRFGEILVGTGVESGDDILAVHLRRHQNDGQERKSRVALETAAGLDTVELRHHHVEENEVGTMLLDRSQRLLTVSSLEGLVAMPFQPRHDDIAIRLVVIDDKDARGIVHNERP